MTRTRPDYSERLRMVGELGRLAPGIGGGENSHGLFAGIYLQTKWQLDSGRSQMPHWHLVNEMLTAAPFHYYRAFASGTVGKYVADDGDLRILWERYFSCAQEISETVQGRFLPVRFFLNIKRQCKLPLLLWLAHTGSIRFALERHANLFATLRIPKEERTFWSNWIRFVLMGVYFPIPTTERALSSFLSNTMPNFAPLGPEFLMQERMSMPRKYFLKLFATPSSH